MLNYPKTFQCDNGSEFKMKRQSCLRNTTLRFEEQQQEISTPIQFLWKSLTKSNTLWDLRMGTIEKDVKCETCSMDYTKCKGY